MSSGPWNNLAGIASPGCADWLTGKRHMLLLNRNSSIGKIQSRITARGIFTGKRENGRSFEHDRKRELYRVSSAAASAAPAGQQVSPPKNEAFATKLNPEACPFNSNAPAKCEFPNYHSHPSSHFLAKYPVFRSKSAYDRQKWITAKNLCAMCFKKATLT